MAVLIRRWRWFAAAAFGLVGLYFCLSSARTIAWVGSKDLEIEFIVLDATTRQLIPGALLRFYNPHPSNYCGGEYRETEFSRTADDSGRVTLQCRKCMCSGKENWYQDTFAIHVPAWYVLVSAAGYTTSDLVELRGRRHRTDRGGEVARVVVEIELQSAGDLPVR